MEELRGFVTPYYETFDIAHRMSHVDHVIHTGFEISKRISVSQKDLYLFEMAAYAHDLGLVGKRSEHHLLSADIVLSRALPIVDELHNDDLMIVADACAEHRASGNGTYSSIVSKMLAASDRGIPDFDRIYNRVVGSRSESGMTLEEMHEDAVSFICRKYGRNGYMKYPDFYKEVFHTELAILWDRIDLESSEG